MEIATIEQKHKASSVEVPDYLIYEVVGGKPIYYKGYKDVLNGTKTFEEITMDSTLQAWTKFRLSFLLGQFLLHHGYEITVGEQGFIFPNKDKRGADLAIFKAEGFIIDEHYSRQIPEAVIEIDVKADTENSTEMDYVLEKVGDYHQFGVSMVFWVFTKNRKIMVAPQGQPWLTLDWAMDVEFMPGLTLNLADLLAKRGI